MKMNNYTYENMVPFVPRAGQIKHTKLPGHPAQCNKNQNTMSYLHVSEALRGEGYSGALLGATFVDPLHSYSGKCTDDNSVTKFAFSYFIHLFFL